MGTRPNHTSPAGSLASRNSRRGWNSGRRETFAAERGRGACHIGGSFPVTGEGVHEPVGHYPTHWSWRCPGAPACRRWPRRAGVRRRAARCPFAMAEVSGKASPLHTAAKRIAGSRFFSIIKTSRCARFVPSPETAANGILSMSWNPLSVLRPRNPTRRPPGTRPTCRPWLEQLEDRQLPSTYLVTNTNDAGDGSLRQAILDANANPGPDTIAFAIGSGVQTITPASA